MSMRSTIPWCCLAIAIGASSCAPTAGAPPASSAPPRQATTAAPATQAPATAAAPIDSTPSQQAIEVLGTIPEPLTPGERVPPPDVAGGDSLSAADTSGVPVPEPTRRLGDPQPTPAEGAAPSAAPQASPAPSSSPAPAAPTLPPGAAVAPGAGAASGAAAAPGAAASGAAASGAAAAPATPDTCWRVQVAAPVDRQEAEGLQRAAASVLLAPMTLDYEQKRYKVRTRDCVNRSTADQLRARAEESGFKGSFKIMEKK